jgi:CRISPR/Cas system CMR-associated protein Cmr5 small subunit
MNRLFALLVLIALTLACGELKDLFALQQGLAAEFKTPAISVNINNGSHLTVTFTNSKVGELSDSDRAIVARQAAEFVRDHYHDYATLEDVSVGFARSRTAGPITYTNNQVPYSFATTDLGQPHDSGHATIQQ